MANTPRKTINQLFPRVAANPMALSITSPQEWTYNCVAWVLDYKDRWMEPSPAGVWPVPHSGFSVVAYSEMFAHFGYEGCADGSLESGFEKIVIYGDTSARFSHVAKQLPDGRWSSKLGELSDVKHSTPDVLMSQLYGSPLMFMRRLLPPPSASKRGLPRSQNVTR